MNSEIDDLIFAAFYKINLLKDRINQIRLNKFTTKTPLKLLNIIQNIFNKFEFKLLNLHLIFKTTPESAIIEAQFILNSIREFYDHLQWIESAVASKMPCSLIRPFEELVETIFPNQVFILIPQWAYNYSYVELTEPYEKSISTIFDKDEINDIFKELKGNNLYLISFPSLETNNLFQLTPIGHELGHRIAEDYLSKEDDPEYFTKLKEQVTEIYSKKIDKEGKTDSEREKEKRERDISNITSRVDKIRLKAIKESLSDLVCFYLFGIGSIFALNELASLSEYMDIISSEYYPPWRYRLRILIDELKNTDLISGFEKIEKTNECAKTICHVFTSQINDLKLVVDVKTDTKTINDNPEYKIAYDSFKDALPKIKQYLKKRLNEVKPAYSFQPIKIINLCERLREGIPCNVTEDLIENKPSKSDEINLRHIIIAGWLYKIAFLDRNTIDVDAKTEEKMETAKGYVKQMEITNRLLMKAIELNHIHRTYMRYKQDANTI